MAAGIELAQFYLSEALRIFHVSSTDPDLILAQKLLEWATLKSEVYSVEIYQKGPYAIRDKKTAIRIIEILERHGWFIRVEGGMKIEGTHRRDVWRVQKI